MNATPPTRGTRNAGFTLIEIAIVTLILGMVIAAVGACLNGGIRVWDMARVFGAAEIEGSLALEQVGRDLRSAFPFSAIEFRRAGDEVTFAGLVLEKDTRALRLGSIRYWLDRGNRALVREATVYPDGTPQPERLAAHVVDLRFAYPDEKRASGGAGTNLPRRVDVDLVMEGDPGQAPLVLSRAFTLPAAEGP